VQRALTVCMGARVKPGHDKEEVHENVTMRL